MSKQVTRWSPDTCGCVIEYAWDSDDPQETRVHKHSASIAACPRHAPHHGKPMHFDTVLEENQRKNRVRELILNTVPSVAVQRMQENGEATIDFHPKKPFVYTFDAQHVLHVTVTGITAATRKKIQKSADAAHGASKVVIH